MIFFMGEKGAVSCCGIVKTECKSENVAEVGECSPRRNKNLPPPAPTPAPAAAQNMPFFWQHAKNTAITRAQ
jgi:hypothetical protein